MYDRKRDFLKRLPLTDDTKLLTDTNVRSNVWRHLTELVLAYLIIFNECRQGKVSTIKLDKFKKAKRGSKSNEIESCLLEMNRHLCKLFYGLDIVGEARPNSAITD